MTEKNEAVKVPPHNWLNINCEISELFNNHFFRSFSLSSF